MAILKAFKGYRPKKELVAKIASLPYDVINSQEAAQLAEGNPHSFLHVVKPEIDVPSDVSSYADAVYKKGKHNLQKLIGDQILVQDNEAYFYIYSQTMYGKTQYGIVGCASVDDYMNNVIKKHELTRPEKENDRMNHIRVTNFNSEPVFFAYPDNDKINGIVKETVANLPEYSFTTDDGISHNLWLIKNFTTIKRLEKIFDKEVSCFYVADGHHRTAAAALVGNERKKNNPDHTGREEYNYFMAVLFPATQLTIIDYNRLIKDLNGLSEDEFLDKLKNNFDIVEKGPKIHKPNQLHNFSLYLNKKWYSLTAKDNTYNDNDPIDVLDVTILTKHVLTPILDITDLRRSGRIDFVGGIRGLEELEKRVDSGEMKAAFALYPVTMQQLIDIADSGNIMPPKTTWFEPKLRSGLVLHHLE